MRWPAQTKDLWINVHMIDSGGDMTTLYAMKWGGSPLGMKRDDAERAVDIIKKRMKNTTNEIWWSAMMQW